MNIYAGNETIFNNNGYGFLKDCLEASVVEVLNGDMYLEFKYPLNGSLNEYLVEENIVKCNVGNNNYQLFRIKRIKKDFKVIEVYATHIFYDLLDNFLLDTAPTNLDAQSFGNWILNRTNFQTNFTFQSDIGTSKSARYVRRNPVECIIGDIDNSMKNLFGGELERDNFLIKFNSSRGINRNVKLIFGKNIKEIKITIDRTSIITRVLPLGFDGLMLPETYVDSPIINNYLTPKIAKIEFSNIKYDPDDEDAYQTLETAHQALRDSANALFANGLDMPKINIKVDWLELSKTREYYNQYSSIERVYLGDTITAQILGIDYQAKVTKTVYNPLTDRIDNYEIGTLNSTISKSVNTAAQSIQRINVESILQTARDNASNQITSALGGYIYKTQDELYIMDTDNPNTAQKVWRWNLNGLGYSSTGIEGPYNLAITQDGQIVGDFIATGTISADRVEGLNGLMFDVGKMGEYIRFTQTGDILIGEQDNPYATLITNDGTYYKDGETIVGQTTKDGSNFKDMYLHGKYYYGIDEDIRIQDFVTDDAMFVAEKYLDDNNEEGFGHFYNGV